MKALERPAAAAHHAARLPHAAVRLCNAGGRGADHR